MFRDDEDELGQFSVSDARRYEHADGGKKERRVERAKEKGKLAALKRAILRATIGRDTLTVKEAGKMDSEEKRKEKAQKEDREKTKTFHTKTLKEREKDKVQDALEQEDFDTLQEKTEQHIEDMKQSKQEYNTEGV